MKRSFTILAGCLALFYSSLVFAQTPEYGKVLYRINAGGTEKATIDTSAVNWMKDNLTNPCPYIDTAAMGNKVLATADSVSFDPSVPPSTPYSVFKSERGLMKWDINTLEYNFPVAIGQKVEVRLYFAEIYWDSAGARVFDVLLENNLVLNDYDIFAEVGHDVGVMKSYEVISDGNLDVDLRRVKQQPKISAIEIIEIQSATVAGIFGSNPTSFESNIFPNPFADKFTVETPGTDISGMKILDYSGKEVSYPEINETSGKYLVDLSGHPKGIYFIKLQTSDNLVEMRKVVKY